jgi:type VI secretion system protein ImpM
VALLPDPNPGFFGKIPARGDFVSRRPIVAFQPVWETWLATLVTVAREALGEAWPMGWLTAPLWHFLLGAALMPPAGAAGALVASADKIGRMFPFTIIGPALGDASGNGAVCAVWALNVEALILDSLGDEFDPDALDSALAALGPPPPVAGIDRPTGHWPLVFHEDWPAEVADLLDDTALQPPGPDQSVWYCRGSDRVRAVHLRCHGLPDTTLAAAMISGCFPDA